MQPELPFLGVLPREKTDAILRGERVEILPHEASRFMILMDERKDRKIADLEREVAAWRERFPTMEYRRIDDLVTLKFQA